MNIGETVYLKSGSPAMTVDEINGKIVTTKWFSGSVAQRGDFPEAGLVSDDPRAEIAKTERERKEAVDPATKSEQLATP